LLPWLLEGLPLELCPSERTEWGELATELLSILLELPWLLSAVSSLQKTRSNVNNPHHTTPRGPASHSLLKSWISHLRDPRCFTIHCIISTNRAWNVRLIKVWFPVPRFASAPLGIACSLTFLPLRFAKWLKEDHKKWNIQLFIYLQ